MHGLMGSVPLGVQGSSAALARGAAAIAAAIPAAANHGAMSLIDVFMMVLLCVLVRPGCGLSHHLGPAKRSRRCWHLFGLTASGNSERSLNARCYLRIGLETAAETAARCGGRGVGLATFECRFSRRLSRLTLCPNTNAEGGTQESRPPHVAAV